jgi:hypothetical protein
MAEKIGKDEANQEYNAKILPALQVGTLALLLAIGTH